MRKKFLSFFKINFYWSEDDLKISISFCCRAKWLVIHMNISIFSRFFFHRDYYWVEHPVLYGRLLILIYFIYSRTTTQKICLFHYRGLECKSRKSRNTWSNRQIWPWSTESSRAKANRLLPREITDHGKHPLPTTQEKTLHMDITRWSTPKSDWLYSLQPKVEKPHTVSKNKIWNWLWLRPSAPYCKIQT